MRKRIYIFTAAAAMALLTACGPKEKTESAPSSQEQAVETTKEAGGQDEGSQGETSQDESKAGGDQQGETGNGQTDASELNPGNGAESGAAGEEENLSSDEKLNQAYQAVKDAYGENYVPDMAYDETALEEIFGLKKDWYDTFVADGPAISVHVETLIGVKAREGKAGDVIKALEDYKAEQLASSVQYPMNVVKFQAAEIASHGDYVFFVMLGSPSMEAEEKGEEAALASAKENNAVGLDAIEACFKK